MKTYHPKFHPKFHSKFYLKSLGCKQNQLEGQIIQDNLEALGYEFVENPKNANFYILNSCSVTAHSDSEANYLLNQAKKLNPDIKTILTGCCAQTYKNKKNFDFSNIDLILGNSEKLEIEKYLEDFLNQKNKEKFFVGDILKTKEFQNKFLYHPKSTRMNIKIQDGCNNRCSYCTIPLARGNSRSNKIENIIKQIDIAIQNNIKEIVLTGIHISQFDDEGKNLLDLIKEIEKTPLQRYRLGSLYINEIDDNMIEFLSKSEKFCPHFHLSLQSLCDKTLAQMNRKYSVDDVFDVVKKLKESFHLPYLGSDIIVGFPNETQDDFKTTYNNLAKLELSKIHCFPFSKRENTPAYFMDGQIQDSIKTQRVKKIMELSEILHKKFLDKNKNEKAQILIQKKSQKTGLYSAITKNYIKIYFKSEDDNLRHTLKTVDLSQFELH